MYLIPTLFLCLSLGTIKKHVQFANGVTSFLYMSDAEMQRDGIFDDWAGEGSRKSMENL